MKNVQNVVARIKHSKEILNLNIAHMLKQEHFSAANVDTYLKVGKMKKNQINNIFKKILSFPYFVLLIIFLINF